MILNRTYKSLPICKKEVLRYAGCKNDAVFSTDILSECIKEAVDKISYKVCYCVFDITVNENICNFGDFSFKSKDLALNLKECKQAVLFAATLGVGIDRLISKYSAVSPSKAMIFQAIGSEQIEALCDKFCEDIKKDFSKNPKPRFSPGYGDFSLSAQKDIFTILNCQKHIGLTLTESLLMSPSKSVTAITGLTDESQNPESKCAFCNSKNCIYRGNL